MRNCCKALSLSLLLLLFGCSSSPTPPGEAGIHPLEQNAINALAMGTTTDIESALNAALSAYRLLDNLPGQWRIHLLRANYFLAGNQPDLARLETSELARIASQLSANPSLAYQTALMQGKTTNNPDAFRRALRLAATPLEQAVAMTYLGEVAAAAALLDPQASDSPNDRAFVAYQYARTTGRPTDYKQALHYYRLGRNPRGIADALLALAQVAEQSGESETAQGFGLRAVHALEAAGDRERAKIIRDWLASL
ncbi:MAG: hypothetical protein ACFHX7_02560 [Pseudomonadota bacterium]